MWSGLKVIKLQYSLRLKINHNDWLLANTFLNYSQLNVDNHGWNLQNACQNSNREDPDQTADVEERAGCFA